MAAGWLVRLWPPFAALLMLCVLTTAVGPLLSASATPAEAQAENPVLVRLEPAVNALGGGPMGPGDAVYRLVRVHNDGLVPFRYELGVRITAAHGLALADHLILEARPSARCDADSFARADAPIAGPSPLSEVDGSRFRPVAPGGVDELCVKLELPRGAPIALNGSTVDAVLQAAATQI